MCRKLRVCFARACATAAMVASFACMRPPPAGLQTPEVVATRASAAPTVTRVAFRVEDAAQARLKMAQFESDSDGWDGKGFNPERVFDTVPVGVGYLYDAANERFWLPGSHYVDRHGNVTFEGEPLAGPHGARVRTMGERQAMEISKTRDSRDVLPLAAWYGPDSTSVLYQVFRPAKYRPHGWNSRPNAPVLIVERFDARTLRLLDDAVLPLQEGWNAHGTLAGFLRDGSVVVGLDASVYERISAEEKGVPHIRGARYATIRIDSNGETKLLRRGPWITAGVTARGDVFGIPRPGRRPVLLGINADGKRIFRKVFSNGGLAGVMALAYEHGVCTLRTEWSSEYLLLSCFDRAANLRWQHMVASGFNDWLIDESGWVYVSTIADDQETVIAIDPAGQIAWQLPVRLRDAKQGLGTNQMIAVGADDLCFLHFVHYCSESLARACRSDLICVESRHGRQSGEPPA